MMVAGLMFMICQIFCAVTMRIRIEKPRNKPITVMMLCVRYFNNVRKATFKLCVIRFRTLSTTKSVKRCKIKISSNEKYLPVFAYPCFFCHFGKLDNKQKELWNILPQLFLSIGLVSYFAITR